MENTTEIVVNKKYHDKMSVILEGLDPRYCHLYEFMKASELGASGAIVETITLFAVLIYEIVGPLLTKIALTKAGDIIPEGKISRREEHKALLEERKKQHKHHHHLFHHRHR